MKYYFLLCVVLIAGCGFYRITDVTIKGTDLNTPYGKGSGDIVYHSQWGFCNAAK
jgi:hypothetical protein